MHSRFFACLILGASSALAQGANPISEEAKALERDFIQAEGFILYRTLSSLPPNEHLLLVGQDGYYAEIGEDFSTSDAISETDPRYRAQHLFTAMSRDVVAFAFISGGMPGTYVNLILKRHGADSGCLYSWKEWGLLGFRVRAMQEELEARRPATRRWSVHRRGGDWSTQC